MKCSTQDDASELMGCRLSWMHAFIGVLTCIAAVLRSQEMWSSWWYDEILIYKASSLDLKTALSAAYYPLAFVLAHFSLMLGDSEPLLRLPSFFAGVASVPLAFAVVSRLVGSRTGIFAALLLCFNSTHIYYSQDGRYYSLLVFAILLCLYEVRPILNGPFLLRSQLTFAAGTTLGLLSHPFFMPVWLVLVTMLLLSQVGVRDRVVVFSQFAKPLFMSVLAGIVVPALAFCYFHYVREPGGGTGPRFQYTLGNTEYLYYLGQFLSLHRQGLVPVCWMIALGGFVVLFLAERKLAALVLSVLSLVPLPFMIKASGHFFAGRYFVAELPFLLLLTALGLKGLTEALNKLIGGKDHSFWIIGSVVASLYIGATCTPFKGPLFSSDGKFKQYYMSGIHVTPHWRADWNRYAQIMTRHLTEGDVLIYYTPPDLMSQAEPFVTQPVPPAMDFYLQRNWKHHRGDLFPDAVETTSADVVRKTLAAHSNSNVWLIAQKVNGATALPQLGEMFEPLADSYGDSLWVCGTPTVNLAYGSQLEASLQNASQCITSNLEGSTNPSKAQQLRTDHNVAVSSVSVGLRLESCPNMAEPDPLTLSLMFKYRKVFDTPGSEGRAFIRVTYSSKKGTASKLLFSGVGSTDWAFHSYILPREAATVLGTPLDIVVSIGIRGRDGEAWIDDLQLERGSRATPFVNGRRSRVNDVVNSQDKRSN